MEIQDGHAVNSEKKHKKVYFSQFLTICTKSGVQIDMGQMRSQGVQNGAISEN